MGKKEKRAKRGKNKDLETETATLSLSEGCVPRSTESFTPVSQKRPESVSREEVSTNSNMFINTENVRGVRTRSMGSSMMTVVSSLSTPIMTSSVQDSNLFNGASTVPRYAHIPRSDTNGDLINPDEDGTNFICSRDQSTFSCVPSSETSQESSVISTKVSQSVGNEKCSESSSIAMLAKQQGQISELLSTMKIIAKCLTEKCSDRNEKVKTRTDHESSSDDLSEHISNLSSQGHETDSDTESERSKFKERWRVHSINLYLALHISNNNSQLS